MIMIMMMMMTTMMMMMMMMMTVVTLSRERREDQSCVWRILEQEHQAEGRSAGRGGGVCLIW